MSNKKKKKTKKKNALIKRKKIFPYLITFFIILVFVCFTSVLSRTKNKAKKSGELNILLVTLDTTRADRIGCYGYEKAKTPNLDSLALNGVMFSNAYCQVPLTLPSHCSLLTGTYPFYHQVRNNGFYYLTPSYLTLAEILKERGFKTSAFVSSFTVDSRFGTDQGFDFYDDKFTEAEVLKNFRSERKADKVYASFSDWLDENFNQKFFCWVHFFDPHVPYDPPSPFKEEFLERPYDGEIAYMDHYIGKMLEKLKEKNIDDNTLIVLVGDHGEAFGEKGEIDHGFFIYDVTLKVPLIFYSQNSLPPGLVINARVRLIDIMPSILEMLEIPANKEIQGVSLLPYIKDRRKDDLPSYIETYYPRENHGWSELIGLINGKWKYIHAPKPELYNLESDPQEEKNVISHETKVASAIRQELKETIQKLSSKIEAGKKKLTREERERLRSLGYLGSMLSEASSTKPLPDPKDKIGEYRLLLQGNEHETQRDFQKAIKYYEELLHLNPNAPGNYTRLALVYQKVKKTKEAIQLLEQGRERIPNSLIILAGLSFSYFRERRVKEALETCQLILKKDPAFFDILVLSGTIKWEKQKWAEALKYFKKAIEIEPENKIL
ncbi:MAG: sulfatase-like hydrolase/transferase, partial [Candidatus Aminicenantes bacterium]